MTRGSRAVATAFAVAACHGGHAAPKPEDDGAAASTVTATATSTATASAAAPLDASALGVVDRAAYAAYTSALVRGRRATIAKKWADAKAAFTDALRARPNDKRALAERGYAELLAGDTDAARTDLEAARDTDDNALAAQAWFNLGLLGQDKDGGASDDTLADFWFSNQLHPSAAARAKIAGRSICPVSIDPKHAAATHASSWLAVAKILTSGVKCQAPKSETDAKALAETPGLPVSGQGTFYVVRSGTLDLQNCVENETHVVQTRGADFWVYPNMGTGTFTFMVPTQPAVDLARFGERVRASATISWTDETIMCTAGDASNEVFACRGDPGEEPAGMAHVPLPPDYTDFFLDGATHEIVSSIEDHASGRFALAGDGGRPVTLRPDGDGAAIAGLGCARTIPFQ